MSTKQQIAEVFEQLVGRVGYDKATLDDVAREMHISKKTIYVHYDSKREIYAHIVAGQAAREKMRLAASVATLPTYAARVEAVVGFVLGSARAHINETGRDEWMREYEVAADAFRQANGELLRELIAAGVETGEFSAGDGGQKISQARIQQIIRAVGKFYPSESGLQITQEQIWQGHRPCSFDGLPFIGRIPAFQNVFAGTGHSMMGVTLAPATGLLLAELISGEKQSLDLTPFRIDR